MEKRQPRAALTVDNIERRRLRCCRLQAADKTRNALISAGVLRARIRDLECVGERQNVVAFDAVYDQMIVVEPLDLQLLVAR